MVTHTLCILLYDFEKRGLWLPTLYASYSMILRGPVYGYPHSMHLTLMVLAKIKLKNSNLIKLGNKNDNEILCYRHLGESQGGTLGYPHKRLPLKEINCQIEHEMLKMIFTIQI